MKHAHTRFLHCLICMGSILALLMSVQTSYAKNAAVEEEEKDESECESDEKGAKNESLGYYIDFGGIPFVPELEQAQIVLHKLKPSPQIHSPQGLYYSSPAASFIMSVDGDDVLVRQSNGKRYNYSFAGDISLASPESQPRSRQRLERVDASGLPITSGTPAYYIEHYSSGDALVFDADTLIAVEYRLASGLVVDLAANSLEVIYDIDTFTNTNSGLRQIKSFEGLADIVTQDEDSNIPDETYEIRLYDVASIGTKVGDLYVPVGAPYKTFVIGNPYYQYPVDDPDRTGSSGDLNRIRITETEGARSVETNFRYDSGSEQWSMDTGNGLKRIDKYVYSDSQTGETYFVRAMLDYSSTVVSKTYNVTKDFSWGNEIIRSVNDPDGFALTTYSEFYTTGDGAGHLKSKRYPDGSWDTYQYDDQGRRVSAISPWKDAPFGSSDVEAKEIVYDYSPLSSSDTVTSADSRPRTRTTKILGTVTERTYYAHNQDGTVYSEVEERAKTQSAAFGDAGNLRTTTTYYDATLGTIAAGRRHTIAVQAVGDTESSLQTFTYAYDATSDVARYTEIQVDGTIASPAGIAYQSLKSEKIYSSQGLLKTENSYVYNGATYNLLSTVVHTYDAQLNRTASTKDGRIIYQANYVDGVLEWSADESGQVSHYALDALGRITTMTQEEATENTAFADQSVMTTNYNRELGAITCGCDGIIVITRQSADGSLSSETQKDEVGRVSKVTDEAGLLTTYDYSAGGRITHTYRPDTGTMIAENYLDGSPKRLTGTGVIHQFYDKGVNLDGSTWQITNTGTSDSPRLRKVTSDFLGRVTLEESLAFTGDVPVSVAYSYNDRGLLQQLSQTGQTATLYVYDSLGQLIRSGLDVDGDDALVLASTDRITDSVNQFEVHDGALWRVSQTLVYPIDNDATAVTVSESRERASGLTGNLVSESHSFDVHGHQTTRTVTIDFATKTLVQTVNTPDSEIDAVSVYYNGLLVEANSNTVQAATQFGYDSFGRRISVTDPRHTQPSTTTYDPATGQMVTQTDAAGHTTTFAYFGGEQLGAGQVQSQQNALLEMTYSSYDAHGRTVRVWGQTDYPQAYSYNPYGELETLTTWRDSAGSIDFSTATWPSPTGGDTITWSYDPATGLLTRKAYADSQGTDYTYDHANRLDTRTWARGVVTHYDYSPSTGDLTSIDYSDTTHDLSYNTYDRLGRPVSIVDATGTRVLAFDPSTLSLDSESFPSAYYGEGLVLDRTFEDGTEVNSLLGRSSGYSLTRDGGVTSILSATYGYESTGRLKTISDATDTFTYDYTPSSNLLASLAAPQHAVVYAYEPNRDVMTLLDNQTLGGTTSVSSYTYTYDALGRRADRQQSGTAFTQTSTDTFGYNTRSEVTSSTNDVLTAAEYASSTTYDQIGNRLTSAGGGLSSASATYTSNNVNQYTDLQVSSLSSQPSFDFDGNLTSDGNWTYTWNAENRLSSATNGTATFDFVYDYQGRLVQQQTANYDSGLWSQTSSLLYVYDGWNRIGTFDSSVPSNFLLQTSYLWGTDLSGTQQGAGGVGGLLKEGALYTIFDANGNIMQKLDGDGATVMNVDYDPFGNIINGTLVGEYGFSTKPLIDGIQWYYYGFRYYDPVTGRWPSRDPIGERGGLNLHGFVDNDPINYIDDLGRKKSGYTGPTPPANQSPSSFPAPATPSPTTPPSLIGGSGNANKAGGALVDAVSAIVSGGQTLTLKGMQQFGLNDCQKQQARKSDGCFCCHYWVDKLTTHTLFLSSSFRYTNSGGTVYEGDCRAVMAKVSGMTFFKPGVPHKNQTLSTEDFYASW